MTLIRTTLADCAFPIRREEGKPVVAAALLKGKMPAVIKDKETVIDGPRPFGLKTPACLSIKGFFQAPFNGCAPKDIVHNFYCTKKVGHYLIGKTLGEGSFAKVREGLHVITDEKVAIKVIDKHKVKNDEYVMKNLYREGHIHQMIRHPNIAQLLEVMESDNNYYLVTELCLGGNLMNRLYERKHLEEREVQKYIRQLIMAVEHLHRAGVVHRDLKIENLLLDENDNIKLIDFGLSNSAGILGYADPYSTQCGSPAYAAPELLNEQKYGPKVDVWSIGVNMYAMLTGSLPFEVEPFSLTSLHEKMVNKEMNPLPPDISRGAVMLLSRLLEPDPALRPTIQQVVTHPWLHGGQVQTNAAYMNRIHNRDINHVVVLHMTEKLGYKYTDVLRAVNKNRASCLLATYFLLNKKMDRLFKVNMEPVEKEKTEPAQPRWATANGKPNFQPMQEPASLAKMKDSVLNPGLLHPAIIGRDSALYLGGTVASSSQAYLEINPILPHTAQLIRRLGAPPLLVGGPVQGGLGFHTSSRVMGVPTSCPAMGVHTSSHIMGVPTSFRVMGAPTSSRVMGVPTSFPAMGVHTSSRIMGVPTSFHAMGVPTSSRIMGVPTSFPAMGVHTSSRIMGVPTSFPVMGAPTSSRIMRVPTRFPAMDVHTSSRLMGVPTSFPAMGAPTSSRIMRIPTSFPVMGAPTSSRIMGVPTSFSAMGVHTSSRIMGVPTRFPAMGAPASSRIMRVPTHFPAMGVHTSSRIMGVPTSFPAMGVHTSSRIMGAPTSSRIMSVHTSSRIMGVPTSFPAMGVHTSSRIMGVPTSFPVMGAPTSSRIMGVPTRFPAMGVHTSSRIMGNPTSFPAMGAPTSSRIMGVPTSVPAMGAHTSSRIMGVPTSFPAMGVHTSSRIMGVHTSSRIMGNPTSFPAMGVHTSSRIMGVPTSFPAMGAHTSSRIMGVHTSSRIMGNPTSFPAMGVHTSSRIMGVPTSFPAMGAHTSSRIMGVHTSSRVMGHSRDTSFQQMNTAQQKLPPWLRVANGPLPRHSHIQRHAPTPTPSPSPPTFALTNPGVRAMPNTAYTDRHQDRFRAVGVGQKNQNLPQGQMFRPRIDSRLPYPAFRTFS